MGFYEYEDFIKAVGRRLKHLREAQNLSLREFGEKYGWSFSQWSQMETGKRLSLDTLLRAADTFNISVEQLLADTVKYEGPAERKPSVEQARWSEKKGTAGKGESHGKPKG